MQKKVSQWAWDDGNQPTRSGLDSFDFDMKKKKQLAKILRSSALAMGFSISSFRDFTKMKSSEVSPDGNLGGTGYTISISKIRQQYSNVIEALSAITDTLYDELHAPHWNPVEDDPSDDKDEKDVENIMEDIEQIKEDPESYAKQEEAEDMAELGIVAQQKTASHREFNIHELTRMYVAKMAARGGKQ